MDTFAAAHFTVADSLHARARARHHEKARLLALGYTVGEVAAMLGVSEGAITLMIDDPAFRQLVGRYEASERGAGSCVAFAVAA